MTADFLRDNVLLFGPGFVFAKLVYLFGEQHRRLEWEWLVWSLVSSVPIAFTAEWLATGAWPTAMPATNADPHAVLRFTVATAAALAVAATWRRIRHGHYWPIRFLRRSLSDSAWDLVLDRAVHDRCGVAVTVERIDDEGNKGEKSFYGTLAAFGYEAAGAEPIIYLRPVMEWDSTEGYRPFKGDERNENGMLFHRDRIARMRIVPASPKAPVKSDRNR